MLFRSQTGADSGSVKASKMKGIATSPSVVIAAACHEQNRTWCLAHGDHSQVPWSQAPEWQRESAIKGVEKALLGETPEQLHESWCADKRADGWVFGEVKNAETKTHPCLVPYDQLPEVQRQKDHLFREMVIELGRLFGLITEKQTT